MRRHRLPRRRFLGLARRPRDGRSGDRLARAYGSPSQRPLRDRLPRRSLPASPRTRGRSPVGGIRRAHERGQGSVGARRPRDRARSPRREPGRTPPSHSAPTARPYTSRRQPPRARRRARTAVARSAGRFPDGGRRARTFCVEASAIAVTVPTVFPSSADGLSLQTAASASEAPTTAMTMLQAASRRKRPWSSRIVAGSARRP